MHTKSIAVIGSGIAGLSSAWMLSRRHRVTLFEKNHYFGGHSHTVPVATEDGLFGVDTGFVVYNEPNYPNLAALFDWLGVQAQPAEMSFAVSLDGGRLEYSGSDLNGLFAQRTNVLRPGFLRMLRDILRFNRDAQADLARGLPESLSLGDYLEERGYGPGLVHRYLLPMAAAIWSCPARTMLRFPAQSFLRFFDNHGLLRLANRPQWRTVAGGSRTYVERLLADLPRGSARMDAAARVRTVPGGVEVVTAAGHRAIFDEVVLACHADQAVALMETMPLSVLVALRKFRYQSNRAVLHSDASLMPINRRTWSSWNYLSETGAHGRQAVSVTYWMNRLQRLPTARPLLVSLNPLHEPRPGTVISEMSYDHPVFDLQSMRGRKVLPSIQGRDHIWFAGSYHGYGFHEDALRSAVDVATRLGAPPPWLREDVQAARTPARAA